MNLLYSTNVRRIMPPHRVLNPSEAMEVMQREIFGPILPVKTYKTREEVVTYIGDRHRPLAFYVFTNDRHWPTGISATRFPAASRSTTA